MVSPICVMDVEQWNSRRMAGIVGRYISLTSELNAPSMAMNIRNEIYERRDSCGCDGEGELDEVVNIWYQVCKPSCRTAVMTEAIWLLYQKRLLACICSLCPCL